MKVLLVNGSPRKNGCTNLALETVAAALQAEGVETEILWLGTGPVQDCIACRKCGETGACVFHDVVEELAAKAQEADGFVFGSPVYYAHPNGRLLSAMDRSFYSAGRHFRFKPAAAVVSARRAGTTASMDVIMKHFTINQMPVVSANYWNAVHGNSPEEAARDAEGLSTMEAIGRNMAWLLKCIELGRKNGVVPPVNRKAWTNFIRAEG